MRKIFYKTVGTVAAIALCLNSYPVKAESYIPQEYAELSGDVTYATQLMEGLLENAYEHAKEEVEILIQRNNYDYAATMESFYQQGNPYAEMDYIGIITALCMCTGNNPDISVCDINYLNVECQEDTVTQMVPVKRDTFKMNEEGTYQKTGIEYITEKEECDVFELTEDGINYRKTGTEVVEPEKTSIKYGVITLHPISVEALFSSFGYSLQDESLKAEYERRYKLIESGGVINIGLAQEIFVKAAQDSSILSDDAKAQLEEAYATATGNRLSIVNTAARLIGQIPYQWGGKSQKAGYDTTWWSFDESGQQKGLDCSGYVQWVYRTAGYSEDTWTKLMSTVDILANCERINESELQIGDLGILNDGSSTNHVGIYIGNGYYIHCSSGIGTVTVSTSNFTIFMRVPGVETEILNPPEEETLEAISYTEDDVYLLAQTICHEAGGEGLNGWIGVAEVIRNRVKSSLFPNSVNEVVYSPGQFENAQDIVNMQPTDAMIDTARSVLDGELSILQNENCLYFRNPGDDNGDWGELPFFTRIRRHVFYLQN